MDSIEASTGVRVLLVDDEVLIKSGLAMLLEGESDIEVVGEAGDGLEAVRMAAALRPDVVVMDIRMPVMDGIEATRQLTSDQFLDHAQCNLTVLILTTFSDDAAVHAALRAGASGFILKNSAPKSLADAVRALHRGAGWLDPMVTRRLVNEFVSRPESRQVLPSEMQRLTRREREVLVSAAHGLKNSEIAGALFLSEATVKTHLHRIYMKLGAADRAQAVAAAFQSGLIQPTTGRN